MTRVFTIAHHAPTTGYFGGGFTIPGNDGPDLLRGPVGEIASAVSRTDEFTEYRFDAVAENWTAAARRTLAATFKNGEMVCDIPWIEVADTVLQFSAHPDTLKRMLDLVPVIEIDGIDGERLKESFREKIIDTPSMQCFHFKFTGVRHFAEAWAEIDARSPWVRWLFIVRRRDGQAGGNVTATWPWKREAIGVIGFAGLTVKRTVCVTVMDPNEYERQAIQNSKLWHGVPHTWKTDLLGLPIIVGPLRMKSYMQGIIDNNEGIKFAGRDWPNSGGVDASFGPTYTAPIWIESNYPDPRIIEQMMVAADIMALRPCHWAEPGQDSILRVDQSRSFTDWTGQPYTRAEADSIGIGYQYRGSNGIWGMYDEEHDSSGVLGVTTVMTGDRILRYICDSCLATECYGRSVKYGYVQPGRGQGNPWIVGIMLARLTADPHLKEAWAERNALRKTQYLAKRKKGPIVCVGGLYDRGSPWTATARAASEIDPTTFRVGLNQIVSNTVIKPGDLIDFTVGQATIHSAVKKVISYDLQNKTCVLQLEPMAGQLPLVNGAAVTTTARYYDGYEQGILTAALYLSGDMQSAFDHGKGLLTSCLWGNVSCAGAYNVRWLDGDWPHAIEIGMQVNEDQKPGGGALGMWVGQGLACFVLAARNLGRQGEKEVLVAQAALRDLFPTINYISESELLCATHRSMFNSI